MSPDVSVVIPTYRRPGPLLEALHSVLSQRGVSVEVRVLDDSPEGSARQLVERLGDLRVVYVKREVPTGGNPAVVRNEGWPRATGRFVHFLDDDDKAAAGAYRALVTALDAAPRRGVAFGLVEPFGDDPKALAVERAYFARAARRARVAAASGSRHVYAAMQLFKHTMFVNSACLIRRECIAPLDGYDPKVRIVEDVDFFSRAIRRFGCVFLDQVVLHYRTGTSSLMHDQQDDSIVAQSYRRMHERYRANHGRAEYLTLKLLARSALRTL